jgi:hypothetical protein
LTSFAYIAISFLMSALTSSGFEPTASSPWLLKAFFDFRQPDNSDELIRELGDDRLGRFGGDDDAVPHDLLEAGQRLVMRYSGGHPAYRDHCDAVAAAGYRQLALA